MFVIFEFYCMLSLKIFLERVCMQSKINFDEHFKDFNSDRWVRVYGFLLVLTHVFTFFYWSDSGLIGNKILSSSYSICWPYFQSCYKFKNFFSNYSITLHFAYASLIFSTLLSFIFSQNNRLKISLFFILLVVKFALFSLDYRFMGNYHYMAFVASIAYLVFPYRLNTLKVVVTCFYVAAGLIKFNLDWLSGAAMLRTPIISGKLLEWAVVYVIYLEILIVPLIFSKNKAVRYFVILQLLAFHLFSWHIVGWFYPCVMSCLLAVYIVCEIKDEKFFWNRKYLYFIVPFFIAQIAPFFLARDSAISGQGRILSLNMLDAMTECQSLFFLKSKDGIVEMPLEKPKVGVRIQCDPIFYASLVRQQCAKYRESLNFQSADLILQIRRVSERSKQESFYWKDVCSHGVPLNILGVSK